VIYPSTGSDLLLAGPLFRKNVGPLIYEYPLPDCLHPSRTVVIINILSRSHAAMYTTIAAAAVWQFVLLWVPLFGRTCLNPPLLTYRLSNMREKD